MNAGDREMQRIEELLAARALGCIEPEDERHLEQVLDARPEIARQLSELEETASLLSFTLAPSDPNPAVRRRVLATCGCQAEAWWNRLANLRWFPALATTSAVTASVLLAVFTTSNVFNSEIDTLENQVNSVVGSWEALEQECSALASSEGVGILLHGQGPAATATGCLVLTANPRQGMLFVSGLDGVAAHGHSFRVWLGDGRGEGRAFGGSCPASTSGRAVVALHTAAPITSYHDLVLTVEPAAKMSDKPLGDPVLWADLRT